MGMKKIIIAIDGYSSCGKSTLSKALARALGYIYIDSGAMYRAYTLFSLRNNWIRNGSSDIESVLEGLRHFNLTFRHNKNTGQYITCMNGEDVEEEIRKLEVSNHVSLISAIREVRTAMVRIQQKMGEKKGIVMDGRDIGTVVFPGAELKIFMIADPEIRARRRFEELMGKGIHVTMDEIRENISRRDYLDQNREESPLRQAEDAIVLDNSYLTPEQQLQWSLDKAKRIIGHSEN